MMTTTKNNTSDADADELLTFCEAANKLHCSTRAVRNLVHAGLLDGLSLTGGRVVTRITLISLRRFIDAATRRARGQ